jgi:hypothetical protein
VLARSAPRILAAYVKETANMTEGAAPVSRHVTLPHSKRHSHPSSFKTSARGVRPRSARPRHRYSRVRLADSMGGLPQMDVEVPAAQKEASVKAEASPKAAAASSPKASPPASSADEPADPSPKEGKGSRQTKTPAQTKVLNEAFAKSDTLSTEDYAALATSTGLLEKDVKDFFTRKRQRERSKSAAAAAAEPKKRKGKDDGKGGPPKKKSAAAAAAAGKSPRAKKVKATAAQTAAAIKAIEAIHGPPRVPMPSPDTPASKGGGNADEVAALKAEIAQLKQALGSTKSELSALKAAGSAAPAASAAGD